MKERRETQRVDVSFPVECNLLTQRNYFYTVSKDLSLGGAKILSNDFLARGNNIKMNINLIDSVVMLKAKVSWCNKDRASDRYLCGVEFTEVNANNKNELCQFLNTIYPS